MWPDHLPAGRLPGRPAGFFMDVRTSATARPQQTPSLWADHAIGRQPAALLKVFNGIRRVVAEVAVHVNRVASLDQSVLKVLDCSAFVAGTKGWVLSHRRRRSAVHPDFLCRREVALSVVEPIRPAVDALGDGDHIIAIRQAVDVPSLPVRDGRHQRPWEFFQLDGIGLEIRRPRYHLTDAFCRQPIIGSSRRLDQSSPTIAGTITGARITEVCASLVGSSGSELKRHAEVSALVRELRHEMTHAERRIDSSIPDELLVIHDSLDDPRGRSS